MAQEWPGNALGRMFGFTGYPHTREDAKPAGGAKMGDPKDVAMEALLQAQNLAISALKDEIKRLRKLVREAYEEGRTSGLAGGHPEEWWKTSNARKALDNAP